MHGAGIDIVEIMQRTGRPDGLRVEQAGMAFRLFKRLPLEGLQEVHRVDAVEAAPESGAGNAQIEWWAHRRGTGEKLAARLLSFTQPFE